MSKILIIHPQDRTTDFLKRIKTAVINNIEGAQIFNVHPTAKSKVEAFQAIQSLSSDGLLLFLGHGRSDMLYGSKGRYYDTLDTFSNDFRSEHPELFYYDRVFLDENNITILKGKKVICLACNSNDKIAKLALENGVAAFIGYGDIPTSQHEFERSHQLVSSQVVAIVKGELNNIVRSSLVYSFKNGMTFNGFKDILDYKCNQAIVRYVRDAKELRHRRLIADFLYFLKRECKVFGDGDLKLFL